MNTQRLKDIAETIRNLKERLLDTDDPRVKLDIIDTIELLNNSLLYEIDRLENRRAA